jgi:hypothetical protein
MMSTTTSSSMSVKPFSPSSRAARLRAMALLMVVSIGLISCRFRVE